MNDEQSKNMNSVLSLIEDHLTEIIGNLSCVDEAFYHGNPEKWCVLGGLECTRRELENLNNYVRKIRTGNSKIGGEE